MREWHGVEIVAFVSSVGHEFLFPSISPHNAGSTAQSGFQDLLGSITRQQVDEFLPTRCPDKDANACMTTLIEQVRDTKDSIGGVVTCVIRHLPVGLGEPCFDKLEAMLAHAMMSIPATKAFSIGSGFGGCQMLGSQHNDVFTRELDSRNDPPRLVTKTNFSGGIQGGISNGAHIYFDVGFKPPATIGQTQLTSNYNGQKKELENKGRHDPCVVPRAPPIIEAMAALTVLDALLLQRSRVRLETN